MQVWSWRLPGSGNKDGLASLMVTFMMMSRELGEGGMLSSATIEAWGSSHVNQRSLKLCLTQPHLPARQLHLPARRSRSLPQEHPSLAVDCYWDIRRASWLVCFFRMARLLLYGHPSKR